jgi:hypothetical protein
MGTPRPETDWEQACHVLLALAAARQALIDAATLAQASGAGGETPAETVLSIPDEVHRAAWLRRAAGILRVGGQAGWTGVFEAPEDRAVDVAPAGAWYDADELWSQLAALHQALVAGARHGSASPRIREVRP